MNDRYFTDQYWGIINSGSLAGYTPEQLEALIAKLEGIPGEGADYAARLRNMMVMNKMNTMQSQLTDFNSPFYKQYQDYLQKTTPQIGVNSLLAPLLAGGASYAGGQNIAKVQREELSRERQDKINTGVKGFALSNIGTGANLLTSQGQLGLGIAQLNEQKRQFNEGQSAEGWQSFLGTLGTLGGFALAPLTGGASLAAIPATQSVAGYASGAR